MDEIREQFKGAEVISMSRHGVLIEYEGVELHVSPQVRHSGCSCCGDTAVMSTSYNRHEEDRIDKHGEADPLDLES